MVNHNRGTGAEGDNRRQSGWLSTGSGVAIGIGIGAAIGIGIDDIPAGLAIGLIIGAGLGVTSAAATRRGRDHRE